MNLQPCPIKACGAKVLLAEVDGRRIPLDPVRSAVAVRGEDGRFTLVQGFQPHAYTCVDIAGRREFLAALRAAGE